MEREEELRSRGGFCTEANEENEGEDTHATLR